MSTANQRLRTHRARQRAGRAVVMFEVDVVRWADILVRQKMLDANMADNTKALSTATQRFVDVVVAAEGEIG